MLYARASIRGSRGISCITVLDKAVMVVIDITGCAREFSTLSQSPHSVDQSHVGQQGQNYNSVSLADITRPVTGIALITFIITEMFTVLITGKFTVTIIVTVTGKQTSPDACMTITDTHTIRNQAFN